MTNESQPSFVEARGLTVRYVTRRSAITNRPVQHLTGVDDVHLSLERGQSYGLVGESGSGKSTLGRALLRLEHISEGTVQFDGRDITRLKGNALRKLRPRMQMIFQDPMGSLNPRQNIATILSTPLRAHRLAGSQQEQRKRISETLDLVGLPTSALTRYPHEFSGGQRQRIGIARAVIQQPDFIVADEPVSALDVSVQAQIVNLLQDIKESLGLTSLVVAHDLAVVRHISDTVGVMYLGSVVEEAPTEELYTRPLHPYTRALLSAAPVPDPELEDQRERIVLHGEIPSPSTVQRGCRFASRCPVKRDSRCDDERPQLRIIAGGHKVACHWAEDFLPTTTRPKHQGES